MTRPLGNYNVYPCVHPPPPDRLPPLPIIQKQGSVAPKKARIQRKPLNLSISSLTKKTKNRKCDTSSHLIETYYKNLTSTHDPRSAAEDLNPDPESICLNSSLPSTSTSVAEDSTLDLGGNCFNYSQPLSASSIVEDYTSKLGTRCVCSSNSISSVAEDTTGAPGSNCFNCSQQTSISESDLQAPVEHTLESSNELHSVTITTPPATDPMINTVVGLNSSNNDTVSLAPSLCSDGADNHGSGSLREACIEQLHRTCKISSYGSILPQPNRLQVLSHWFLTRKLMLNDMTLKKLCSNYKFNIVLQPVSLVLLCREHLLKVNPKIDLDEAQTKLLKYKILKKYDIYTSKVEQTCNLDKLLKTLTLKRKVDIVVPKLKSDVVNLWMNKVPHWSTIDPYSSLEEMVSDTDSHEETPDAKTSSEGVYFSNIGGHVLQKRQRNYNHVCTHQASTKYVFYRDMCNDSSNKVKCTPSQKLTEPSETRLKAQDEIRQRKDPDYLSVNCRLTRSYHLFHKPKRKPVEKSSSESELDTQNKEDTPETPKLEFEESKQQKTTETSSLAKKGKLITKTFGVKQPEKSSHG